MIKISYMDSEQVLIEIQIDGIIQQMRTLSDEAIAILYGDGLLCTEYICDMRGIFGNIFNFVCLLTRARQVTDAWHQEARTVAYVITT